MNLNPFKIFKKTGSYLPRFKFSISLIPSISAGVLAIIIISGLITSIIFYTGMRSESLSLGQQNLKSLENSVEENLQAYFDVADNVLNSISNTAIELDMLRDEKKLLALMRGYLIVNKDIAAIYCALDSNGSFYMAKRMTDGSFSLRTVKREGKKIVQRWYHENPSYDNSFPMKTVSSLEDGYDPRKRGWYKEAYSNNNDVNFRNSVIWTSPYVFSSDRQLGITVAKRLVDSKRRKFGVFAVDLTLEKMSVLLSKSPLVQKSGGHIYITDTNNTIMANSFPTVGGIVDVDTDLLWKEQQIGDDKPTQLIPINAKDVHHPLVQGIEFSKEKQSNAVDERHHMYTRYNIRQGDFLDNYIDKLYDVYYDFIIETRTELLNKVFPKERAKTKYIDLSPQHGSRSFAGQYLSFYQDNEPYIANEYKLYPNPRFPVNLNIIYPFSIIVDPINNLRLLIETTAVPVIIFTIIIAIFFARAISLPILRVSDGMLNIKNFKLAEKKQLEKQPGSIFKEILEMQHSYVSMNQGLISFKKYVPTEIVSQLIKQGQEAVVSGEKALLTILFSDIEGFTQFTEKTPSEILIKQLRTYFNHASTTISEHQGTLDKYIGDSIMAFWGAPQSSPNHAINACLAALACKENLIAMNRVFSQNGMKNFYTRFGINTGEAIVGNIGSDARLNYTAIGDSVNTASRLEGLNKFYRTQILISDQTYEEAKSFVEARLVDQVAVYGKEEPIRIYELLGRKGKITKEQSFLIESFFEAFSYIEKKEWREAIKIFGKISSDFPEDEVTKILLRRCYEIEDGEQTTFVFHPKSK